MVHSLQKRHSFQDRGQPGHQDALACAPNPLQPPNSSRPVPPGEPPDDSPLLNCPIRDVVETESDRQLLASLRRASSMAIPRCMVSCCATAWAESLEGAMSGPGPSSTDIFVSCCLRKSPRALREMQSKNSGCSFGRQATLTSLSDESQDSNTLDLLAEGIGLRSHKPTNSVGDEPRTARGSISKAMKGLVGGAAQAQRTVGKTVPQP